MNKVRFVLMTVLLLTAFVFTVATAEQYTNEEQYFNQKITEGKYADFKEQTATPAAPPANTARIYAIDNGAGITKIYVEDSAGTATDLGASASVGTLDASYDAGGAGVGRTINATDGAVVITSTDADAAYLFSVTPTPGAGAALGGISIASGANSTQDSLHIVNSGTGDDIEAGNSAFKVSTTGQVTEYGATIGAGGLTVSGTTTLTGAMYQADIKAAAAGNTNLTLNAAGNGTISVGNVSTGAVTITPPVVITGNADIGDAAADTLTIVSSVDGDLTLYDAVTDSPSLILKDGTATTATLTKTDNGYATFTTAAGTGLQITTGNLRVGNAAATVALDGEDAYIEGSFEVDGPSRFDGTVLITGAPTITNATTTFTLPAAGTIVIDAATTDNTGATGVINLDLDTKTNGAAGLNVKTTALVGNTVSQAYNGILVDLDDDTDAAGTINGIYITATDNVGSSETRGISIENTVDTGMLITAGAAEAPLKVDAQTTVSTNTTGAIDLNFQTITNGANALDIDFGVGNAGAGVTSSAIYIDMDDDTSGNAATMNGVKVYASDVTGQAATQINAFYVGASGASEAGTFAAFQADYGYVRIGTGSTPDLALGDDNEFIEGSLEVDGPTRHDGVVTINKFLGLGAQGTTLTIATGVITATKSYHVVDTEAAAASDDLDTINGGVDGYVLVLEAVNAGHTVVVKNATGNINCPADVSLDNSNDTVTLMYNSVLSKWLCLASSNNGA